jgi:hypothetical protein
MRGRECHRGRFVRPFEKGRPTENPHRADSAAEQKLVRGSELRVRETAWGHIGLFGMDPRCLQQVDAALEHLLARSV